MLRDLNPFFASSELAVVHAASDQRAPDALERLAALLDGNFQFLGLLEAAVAAAAGESDQPTAGTEGPNPATAPAAAGGAAQRYPELLERIRQQVEEAVPAGETVAVISEGDDRLLEMPGRHGWHFPQDGEGAYAGHHPADSTAARQGLEALRQKGARFLLVPATAGW